MAAAVSSPEVAAEGQEPLLGPGGAEEEEASRWVPSFPRLSALRRLAAPTGACCPSRSGMTAAVPPSPCGAWGDTPAGLERNRPWVTSLSGPCMGASPRRESPSLGEAAGRAGSVCGKKRTRLRSF